MPEEALTNEGAEGSAEESEDSVIHIPEIILIVMVALSADLAEILGFVVITIPIVGIVIFALLYFFGLLASGTVILWSFLRGGINTKRSAKRIVTVLLSSSGDAVSGGVLPLRTVGIVVAIWLHNRDAKGRGGDASSTIKKTIRTARQIYRTYKTVKKVEKAAKATRV